jgi:hypothetical protein
MLLGQILGFRLRQPGSFQQVDTPLDQLPGFWLRLQESLQHHIQVCSRELCLAAFGTVRCSPSVLAVANLVEEVVAVASPKKAAFTTAAIQTAPRHFEMAAGLEATVQGHGCY